MKIGKFQINTVETCIFYLDGGAMFGIIPKTIWSKNYDKGDELNRIPLSARLLIIRWEDKICLVDTGNGMKLNEKLQKIYNFDINNCDTSKILLPLGLNAEDITDVILTHLHFDHSGGATKFENGELMPSFPNAKYYVQKEQYEWGMNPSDKDRASFFKENYEPLKINGILELLDGEGELFPGIELITLYGHTKCMQAIKINDGGSTAFYPADLCPTTAHIGIPYVMGYDNEPLQTIAEKKKILPMAYEGNWTFIYEHDAYTQATKIISNEKGFFAGEKIDINID